MNAEDRSANGSADPVPTPEPRTQRGLADRIDGYRTRGDRAASVLLVAAAVCVLLGGIVLALGFPAPHTILVYVAVALGGLGVLLALPRVFSSVPFDPDHTTPRRRADD